MVFFLDEGKSNRDLLSAQNWFERARSAIAKQITRDDDTADPTSVQISEYIIQVLAGLLELRCIDEDMLSALGNRLNSLYAAHDELKGSLGALVLSINKKAESIDNYSRLIEEIDKAASSEEKPCLAISKMLCLLDRHTMQDKDKMDTIVRSMDENNFLLDEAVPFLDILVDLFSATLKDVPMLMLLYKNMQHEYVAQIIKDGLLSYYMLPEKVRRMKSKKSIAENTFKLNDIDPEFTISPKELYETLIEAYESSFVQQEVDEKGEQEENDCNEVVAYINTCCKFISDLETIYNTISQAPDNRPNYEREQFSRNLVSAVENLRKNSLLGKTMHENILHLELFVQKAEDAIPSVFENITLFGENVKINSAGGIETETADGITTFYLSEEFSQWLEDYFRKKDLSELSLNPHGFVLGSIVIPVYKKIAECLEETVDQKTILLALHDCINDFPIRYAEDIQSKVKDHILAKFNFKRKKACISARIEDNILYDEEEFGEFTYGFEDDDDDVVTVCLKFYNVPTKFKVQYEVLENYTFDFGSFNAREYYSIKWGNWISSNELELVFSRKSASAASHVTDVKVWVKEEPRAQIILHM